MACFVCFGSVDQEDQKDEPVQEDQEIREFSYNELVEATENFENKIGEGGYGGVYRGIIEKKFVAVKRQEKRESQGKEKSPQSVNQQPQKRNSQGEEDFPQSVNHNTQGQMKFLQLGNQQHTKSKSHGEKQFESEINLLRKVRHSRIIKFIGYCNEGSHRLLVYEYMSIGSLDDCLHKRKLGKKVLGWWTGTKPLGWSARMNIAMGVAEGLQYLHSQETPIIFRDMKPANILLDQDFEPKISDFGISRAGLEGDKSHVYTGVVGTPGYIDPEYLCSNRLRVESDFYSFGVVLLELISGRKSRDIVAWAYENFYNPTKSTLNGMADPFLHGQYKKLELYDALSLAAMCIKKEYHQRPKIEEILVVLQYLAAGCRKGKATAVVGETSNPGRATTLVGETSKTRASRKGKEVVEG